MKKVFANPVWQLGTDSSSSVWCITSPTSCRWCLMFLQNTSSLAAASGPYYVRAVICVVIHNALQHGTRMWRKNYKPPLPFAIFFQTRWLQRMSQLLNTWAPRLPRPGLTSFGARHNVGSWPYPAAETCVFAPLVLRKHPACLSVSAASSRLRKLGKSGEERSKHDHDCRIRHCVDTIPVFYQH